MANLSTNRKPRSRPNGAGTAIKLGKTWTAIAVVDWKTVQGKEEEGPHLTPVYRKKGGFAKKSDALAYCPTLKELYKQNHGIKNTPLNPTLQQVYEEWYEKYSPRIVKSTMGCYSAAFTHFQKLHGIRMSDISAQDLQDCMDECKNGKRTHQNMKVLAGLLWKYAKSSNLLPQNITEDLYIGKHETVQREALTEKEVKAVKGAIGKYRYAEYVYAACFLGFRPTELLSLKKEHYRVIDGYECLVNGMKTEAGRDRVVIIPPQILDIIRSRLFVPGTDLIFPQYRFDRKGEKFKGFKEMKHAYFREDVFKPMMKDLGIAEGKTPYATRHTYSDKLKRAEGGDKAKAELMGHTDYAFTQSHYQSTDMDDLVEIAASLE